MLGDTPPMPSTIPWPMKPVANPAIGPKLKPTNGTRANPGLTAAGPYWAANRPSRPYRAAPIKA